MIDYLSTIRSQFLATLAMLQQSVEKCPDSFWNVADDKVKFWHIAYHGLFFTHLYLQSNEAEFRPWPKHRPDYQAMGPITYEGNRLPEIGEPYTKAEILEYLAFCRQQVEQQVANLDLSAPSGFGWLPMSKFELQIYSIRHLQQHTGELMERLGSREGISVDWVGMEKW
ncbi:MAG: DinB family protein [Caldilineaceae bacterium]